MAILNCQIEIPNVETSLGKASPDVTVGRPFLLQCEGEWPELNKDKLELRLEEADKYKLRLLEFQKTSSSHGQLLVTSYKAGEHQLKAVQLVDTEHSVILGDLNLTVKSVLSPEEPESEPFGPMGPLTFGLPWYYFVVALLIVTAVFTWVGVYWRRRSQKKKLITSMNLQQSSQQPMAELSQKLRQILRVMHDAPAGELIVKIDESFRIYLARRFLIPTLAWSDRLILKDFKKNHSAIFEVCGTEVAQTLRELGRAQKTVGALELKDLEQIFSHVRKTSELIEKQISVLGESKS